MADWMIICVEIVFIVICFLNELSMFINFIGIVLTILCGITFTMYCDMLNSQRGRDSLENLVSSTHFKLKQRWDKIIH